MHCRRTEKTENDLSTLEGKSTMINGAFYDGVHEARRSVVEVGAVRVWCVQNYTIRGKRQHSL